MKTYTITLTCSIKAESQMEALDRFVKESIEHWDDGENIDIEEE
jgi:hypothetical protein